MLFPCILFTLYIYTNSRALRSVSLPILSVLKSLCPLGIAIAERLVFKDVIAPGTASAMVLVVIGNAVTVMNDIEYTPVGYAWSFANVAINIAYLLSLRLCLSDSFTPLEKTMHSNMIACFIMFPISFANNEHPAFIHDFHATNTTYRVVYFFSCLLAAGIGASIFWVVQTTSGATLSFVGACNKFSVVILGGILFHANITAMGWVSVSFGVLAGMIFAVAKARGAVTKVDTEDDRGSDRDEVSVDASEISDDDRVEDPLMK